MGGGWKRAGDEDGWLWDGGAQGRGWGGVPPLGGMGALGGGDAVRGTPAPGVAGSPAPSS